ncbi:MAG: SDR family NAD(P)-dependent oxidoreductase [Pseudomonadales bacterium]|nr:SDR family NAD(P)-dependent oxidoreductase [Pseudomonadales bacterium]
MMNYLITGATGFIGRFVVEELAKRENTQIYALVRPGSEHKLEAIRQQLDLSKDRLIAIHGDLTAPMLGIAETDLFKLKDQIEHVFHLAAIYDLTAPAEPQQETNVEGTRQALLVSDAIKASCFHHVSSIAVAGTYKGLFSEEMFAEGSGLTDPYFETKHLAEKCVREEANIPYRIYRPSMVVGHSQTGVMDKIDGPYYLFQLLEVLGNKLPNWLPIVGIEGGQFNIVPVDYVAKAMVHIAHEPNLDGQCFHLTDPEHHSLGELLGLISKQSSDLPAIAWKMPNTALNMLPEQTIPNLAKQQWIQKILDKLKIAPSALGYVTYKTTFSRYNTESALANSNIKPPRLADYMPNLWDYWQSELSPQLADAIDKPDPHELSKNKVLFRRPKILPYLKRARDHWRWNAKSIFTSEQALADRVNGKTMVLTGASSGIGAQVAHRLADAGATVILVARSKDKLEELAEDIQDQGGNAFAYPANLADGNDCDRVCQDILNDHGSVDILINNAGRSIRRSIKFSFDRFHDYERTMQINYFGSVRMAMNLLPSMLEQGDGHVINVSTVGVQASPARFSAYLGSKWALEGWSWVAANELAHTGVTVSTINYPLVRTPMIAPTKIYDYTPAMSPEKAVDWMLDIIITRNKRKVGPLGLAALGMYYALPKTSETIVNTSYQMVYEAPPKPKAGNVEKPSKKPATSNRKKATRKLENAS